MYFSPNHIDSTIISKYFKIQTPAINSRRELISGLIIDYHKIIEH